MAEPERYDLCPMNALSQPPAETRYVTRSSRAFELWQEFFFFTADRRRVGI